MATKTKKSASRSKLVEGCGTILKENRLKGGYKLVKRKKEIGASASASASAPATAPAKRRGRPAKAKMTASAPATAPAKRRGKRKSVKA
jgi:hypothetical protein